MRLSRMALKSTTFPFSSSFPIALKPDDESEKSGMFPPLDDDEDEEDDDEENCWTMLEVQETSRLRKPLIRGLDPDCFSFLTRITGIVGSVSSDTFSLMLLLIAVNPPSSTFSCSKFRTIFSPSLSFHSLQSGRKGRGKREERREERRGKRKEEERRTLISVTEFSGKDS